MFATTTHSEYSMERCPQGRPFFMDKTPKWKSNKLELAPSCPRCASSNTKFCYYNNYSLSQPRYFCKACRRYWTKGGSLRNIPIGGGCRKSRRARAARLERAAIACPGPTHSPEPTNETIDLAVVFAKYLNRDVESHDQESSSQASSYNNIDSQVEGFSITLDRNGQPSDSVDAGDDHDHDHDQDQLQQVIPQASSTFEGINDQDFVYQNCGDLEMQSILGEELAGDLVWSDDMNLANIGSQESTAQIQDFGLFSADNEPRIPANSVHYNWGSFDLSGYEIFSRP